MRKKVAVFANAWGAEYFREVVTGAFQAGKEAEVDIFAFVDFSSIANGIVQNTAEANIFRLPNLADFDGAIVLANSFNTKDEELYVHKKIVDSGIPAVCVGYNLEGITSIETDNYSGMYELAKHIVVDHNVRDIVFVGGPENHEESQIRLKAVKDVAEENGFSIAEDNILYGDWAEKKAIELVTEWLDSKGKLPGAFICANDVTAMGVYSIMWERGYSIPDDVIVTGYDCTMLGQSYNPPISSVSHEWSSMGIKTMQILLDKISGKECEAHYMTKTRFVCGGSCGCSYDRNEADEQIDVGRKRRYNRVPGAKFDSHFRHIYLATRKISDKESLHESLNELFERENWIEGKNFMICLEKEFFNIVDNDENLLVEGYNDDMEVICSLDNGVARPLKRMSYRDAIRIVNENCAELGIYTFTPIYSEGRTYGFSMITRDLDVVMENYLYSLTRHMNQYFEQVRNNITIAELTKRLEKLSITDTLTGVYNRAGCEQIAYAELEKCKKNGVTGIVMIADVDRMKNINDKYGHASGDLALKLIAKSIKSTIPTNWSVSRIGGDEFFIGGCLKDDIDLEAMVNEITSKLESEKVNKKIEFPLSISIGYTLLKPDDDSNIEKSLQKADKLMYLVKRYHHAEADLKENME